MIDCADGDTVWRLRKKRRKQRKEWIHEYIFNCWKKNTSFKASSKINMNSKVIFVAITIYLFYRFCWSSGEKCFGKREASANLSIAWVWAKSHGLGVGSFNVAEPGSSPRIILSCVNKLTKENTGFFFRMDWLKVFKDFFSKLICLLNL